VFERSTELTFRVLFTKLADELGISVGYTSSSQSRKITHRSNYLDIETLTEQLTSKLIHLLDAEADLDEDKKFYGNLRDAFNAFDEDGSGELAYQEFKEVCKFLGSPTKEAEIKALFLSTDTDNSGVLDFAEVAVAIMGPEKAMKYSMASSLTKANNLVDSVSGAFASFKGSLSEMAHDADERAR
jgi:hypothetical protein